MTMAQALAWALASGLDRLDAQLLLLHTLGRPLADRAWLLAHDGDVLAAAEAQRYRRSCGRRAAGEPLAYIVGQKEFFGLQLAVDARVLVPRPDTETLVEWALELLEGRPGASVIDLGTGSGAIALAIKNACPGAEVEGVDTGPGALAVAAANAQALNIDVAFRMSSWLSETTARYDLIVSNPPYVAAHDPHLAALTHEPLSALVAGPDGLDALREIVAEAPSRLKPGGWLLLEHGWDQAQAVWMLLREAGFTSIKSRHDLAGIERCSGGRRPELG